MNKPELNPVAEKWVAALRSGKIKQTTEQLGREDGSRCCLGVLCDLAAEAGVISGYFKTNDGLPVKVMEWAGLANSMGVYRVKLFKCSLAEDNDLVELSFAKIADIIESQPDGLFL